MVKRKILIFRLVLDEGYTIILCHIIQCLSLERKSGCRNGTSEWLGPSSRKSFGKSMIPMHSMKLSGVGLAAGGESCPLPTPSRNSTSYFPTTDSRRLIPPQGVADNMHFDYR